MSFVTISIKIPLELSERYDRLTKSTGRTKTYHMNEALS